MTRNRTKVGKKVLEQLKREARGKCANPGCPTHRTHIHHIREWYVYRTHDAKHMIAVCPTCHDQIHHGDLSITDETIYRWKEFIRLGDAHRGHLYIEPAGINKVLTGSTAFVAPFTLQCFTCQIKITCALMLMKTFCSSTYKCIPIKERKSCA